MNEGITPSELGIEDQMCEDILQYACFPSLCISLFWRHSSSNEFAISASSDMSSSVHPTAADV
jgi:hypothetical protein